MSPFDGFAAIFYASIAVDEWRTESKIKYVRYTWKVDKNIERNLDGIPW